MRWVITGANRGIGLEFVRQLSGRGDTVEAGVRDPNSASDLVRLAGDRTGLVRIAPLDVTSDESVRAFAAALRPEPIDVLVNNAGVMGKMQSFAELDLDDVVRTFDVNALGPIRVTRALMPLLLQGKTRRVVHITSGMGSIADNTSGGAYGYRMSKAALNMANKSLSRDFRDEKLVAVVMNPGWVQTDMGGHAAPTKVADSVRMMLARIDVLGDDDSGSFVDYKGGTYPF
jgi:NAD(P)-dependent dehydrogenase (short-subunit alcohol dehydrogenase family)